jgi:kynureninase
MMTRADFEKLDAQDPLAGLRQQFILEDGLIYLDGNSLGVLPRATAPRVAQVVQQEWGQGLIRSWNSAGWISLSQRVGNKIAQLIGARSGEVVAVDSTSINLFKVLAAALGIAQARDPARTVVLSEAGNFPTDLYVAQGLSALTQQRCVLKQVESGEILGALSQDTAVLMLTHVNYKTGAMWDMSAITAAAQARGVLVIWDLAHSAGAVEVDLHQANADFAVGCGYKYLNGGPGAPAFVWMHPRHAAHARQPLSGWLGHVSPFAFSPDYSPAHGITQFVCGTPPVISLAALECGVDTVLAAGSVGGMRAVRAKSTALTRAFIACITPFCERLGLTLISPRQDDARGSQVCYAHANAYAVMQALIERRVIGDFRAPDVLRFGFTPLYTRFADVFDAAQGLQEVLATKVYAQERFTRRQAVT